MPFYTRLWTLTPNADDASTYETSSTVYGMRSAANLLVEKGVTAEWSQDDGQNYASWQEGDIIYKIWLEDASSAEQRLKLVNENSLAGASFWKLGFETNDIWDTIIKYIN